MSNEERDAVIVDVVRTTMGKRGGALSNWHPVDLLGFALTSLVERTGIDPETVDDVIGGCVTQSGEQGTQRHPQRLGGGGTAPDASRPPPSTGSAARPSRPCTSPPPGVMAGHYDLAVACGVESMTRAPDGLQRPGGHRSVPPVVPGGHRRPAVDAVPGGPGPGRPVGRSPGRTWTRYALESHRRARGHRESGHFAREAVPVPIKDEDGAPDRCVPGAGRGHPAQRHARGPGRSAARPELGAGHRARHHRRELLADDRRGGGHADRRAVGGRASRSPRPGSLRPRHGGGRRRRHRPVGPGPGHPPSCSSARG